MSTKKSLTIISVVLLLLLAGCAQQSKRKAVESLAQNSEANNLVRVSAENADAAEPALSAAPDGTAYVVWVEHRENKEADVMLAHLDSEGKMKDAPVRVNPQAGTATAWRGDPPTVKVAPEGTVYVGWTARFKDSQAHGNDLYVSASRDGG